MLALYLFGEVLESAYDDWVFGWDWFFNQSLSRTIKPLSLWWTLVTQRSCRTVAVYIASTLRPFTNSWNKTYSLWGTVKHPHKQPMDSQRSSRRQNGSRFRIYPTKLARCLPDILVPEIVYRAHVHVQLEGGLLVCMQNHALMASSNAHVVLPHFGCVPTYFGSSAVKASVLAAAHCCAH
jgi:hypothetical protein